MHKIITIQNKTIRYTTDYRNVKHPRLEFKTGKLLLIVPQNWKEHESELLKKHETWIYRKHSEITKALSGTRKKKLNRERSEEALKAYVRQYTSKYFDELKVPARALRFRQMKSKWASCT
ncbi:MAG: hypothetical protein AB1306_11975, partial [Nitrospirota bacterium]